MHENKGRVFGKHLENHGEKGMKLAKGKRDCKETSLEELGGKENILNDAVSAREGRHKLDSPQKVHPYQQEIYEFLHSREQLGDEPRFLIDETNINESVRTTTIKFIVKLAKCYNLEAQTLFQTVHLMDQMILKLDLEPEELEIISLTCLFIACKYEEIYPPPIWALIKGTDVKVEEIIEKEKEILYTLNFNVISDTTLIWIQLFCELLRGNVKFMDQIKLRCMQLAELSLTSSLFLNYYKSTVALSILVAVEIMFGCQKTQFQWDRLTEHKKPSKDSKPLKLLTYLLRIK